MFYCVLSVLCCAIVCYPCDAICAMCARFYPLRTLIQRAATCLCVAPRPLICKCRAAQAACAQAAVAVMAAMGRVRSHPGQRQYHAVQTAHTPAQGAAQKLKPTRVSWRLQRVRVIRQHGAASTAQRLPRDCQDNAWPSCSCTIAFSARLLSYANVLSNLKYIRVMLVKSTQ